MAQGITPDTEGPSAEREVDGPEGSESDESDTERIGADKGKGKGRARARSEEGTGAAAPCRGGAEASTPATAAEEAVVAAIETIFGTRAAPERVLADGRGGGGEPAWRTRDSWAKGSQAAITLCDECLGRWINTGDASDVERRRRQRRAEERAEQGEVAHRGLSAADTAQERAWTGERVRDALMLEADTEAEVVRRIDGRAFGRHSLPGLRRLGPEMGTATPLHCQCPFLILRR